MQEILMVLSFGIISGLLIGRKIATKEIEIMARKIKKGLATKNLLLRNTKYKFKINFAWEAVKRDFKSVKNWRNIKTLNGYDLKARRVWYELKDNKSRREGRKIEAYLIGK